MARFAEDTLLRTLDASNWAFGTIDQQQWCKTVLLAPKQKANEAST